MKIIVLSDGRAFGTLHVTGGIFVRRKNEKWMKVEGIGQTPCFRTPAHLRAYLRRHFDPKEFFGLRIIAKAGWDE